MTILTYFATCLLGACLGAAFVVLLRASARKHMLSISCTAFGIAIGLTTSRHLFLGTDYFAIFMIIFGGLGAGLGTFSGQMLERRLKKKANAESGPEA